MLKKHAKSILSVTLCAAIMLLTACKPTGDASSTSSGEELEKYTMSSYAMSTVITQTVYGDNGQTAANEVSKRLTAIDREMSMFDADSYIYKINQNAGIAYVEVPAELYLLLKQAVELSATSNDAFRVTIGPLTQAWGVTTDTPRVVPESEREELLQLVNDEDLLFDEENCSVMLRSEGQSLDLGAIAKGWACAQAKAIYEEYGVFSAVLSIGGNVYIYGTKQDGSLFKVAFRDPTKEESAYMATLFMENEVLAVSGGYNRYFEVDGIHYDHIIDPQTGAPVVSDITSVGVIHEDGAYADFMSTTLYVWGIEKTLAFMEENPNDCAIIMLDTENAVVYVSKTLEGNFALYEGNSIDYEVIYI